MNADHAALTGGAGYAAVPPCCLQIFYVSMQDFPLE